MQQRIHTPRTGIIKVRPVGSTTEWKDIKGLPDPQSIQWSIQDLDTEDGSGRNASGLMMRDRVAIKRKISITWGIMETDTISAILDSAIKNQFFECRFLDAKEGGYVTKTMYVGDRSTPLFMKKIVDGNTIWFWNGMTADFIER